jgi:hypothetical protein
VHLAQINVARLLRPLDAPETAEFVAALAPVNALADAAPGFVWRLQGETGDATPIRVFDDDAVIVNLSVWESLEAFRGFVYDGGHLAVLRRRLEWFERPAGPHTALWWVDPGTLPTPEDGARRLALLAERGPTAEAFDLAHVVPPPT